ncbi:hypothetical protein CEXT_74491 [Caerostris extrusa]|uniref:Uncharacterized protein n=1 Tax=Caerostris extrusa TaxID=172846 RepID=A0AAV4VFI1_CAEEX|nr:hypothetical protein CEXT_74491 [Caerostris extrusa]
MRSKDVKGRTEKKCPVGPISAFSVFAIDSIDLRFSKCTHSVTLSYHEFLPQCAQEVAKLGVKEVLSEEKNSGTQKEKKILIYSGIGRRKDKNEIYYSRKKENNRTRKKERKSCILNIV